MKLKLTHREVSGNSFLVSWLAGHSAGVLLVRSSCLWSSMKNNLGPVWNNFHRSGQIGENHHTPVLSFKRQIALTQVAPNHTHMKSFKKLGTELMVIVTVMLLSTMTL